MIYHIRLRQNLEVLAWGTGEALVLNRYGRHWWVPARDYFRVN